MSIIKSILLKDIHAYPEFFATIKLIFEDVKRFKVSLTIFLFINEPKLKLQNVFF